MVCVAVGMERVLHNPLRVPVLSEHDVVRVDLKCNVLRYSPLVAAAQLQLSPYSNSNLHMFLCSML